MSNDLLSRITVDLEICHGKPCVRGLRYTVESILETPVTPKERLDKSVKQMAHPKTERSRFYALNDAAKMSAILHKMRMPAVMPRN